MAEMAWTVYWDFVECYIVEPGGSPRDPRDPLILIVNADGHENGYDKKTAEVCAKALTQHFNS